PWDNTVRYNLGVRAQHKNDQILGNPNFDDGDRNFSNGSIVTNRLDLLSEFDFVYQKYKFQLSYNGFFGDYSTTPTGAMDVPNGTAAALSDRGWVSFTFKTTF